MDYLVDCECRHDLTRHHETGCAGNGRPCACNRTKLEALDAAIDQARVHPWSSYAQSRAANGAADEAAGA